MKYLKAIIGILGLIVIISWGIIRQINVRTLNDPNIIIVESWLPSPYIEQVNNYLLKNEVDSVWIVGMKVADTPIYIPGKKEITTFPMALNWNSFIRVNFNPNLTSDSILIDIKGSKAFGVGAFILIYINDEFAFSKIISKRDILKIPFSLASKNMTLVFANDASCLKEGDRNVIIYSINDETEISKIEKKKGRVNILPSELHLSEGQKTKLYLQALGCESKEFILIEGQANGNNKTLQSSLLFRKWLSENFTANKKLRINIFTTPQHAKRTYINYKNALKDIAKVGVYTFENSTQICEGLPIDKKFTAWADETASTVFSYFYWLFH